jgi:hypothetical protein
MGDIRRWLAGIVGRGVEALNAGGSMGRGNDAGCANRLWAGG